MKLLYIAVLLAVMQTLPPVPRKAPDSTAGTGQNVQEKAANNQAPAVPSPPAVEQNKAIPSDANGSKQGNDDAEQSITISKLPTVMVASQKRDWADWGYWAFNLLLVCVGGFQVYLLWKTLGAIQKQADSMEKQTEKLDKSIAVAERSAAAAKASADALVDIERAWMLIDKIEIILTPSFAVTSTDYRKIIGARVKFTNFGKTPAWVVEFALRFGKEDATFFDNPTLHRSIPLPSGLPYAPNHSLPVERRFENELSLTDSDWEAIGNGNSILLMYGFLKYRDAFFEHTKQLRETWLCFRYYMTETDILTNQPGKWIPAGPIEANKNT